MARPDLGVVRLDKQLLTDVAMALDRALTTERIVSPLRDLHVQYLVAETDWLTEFADIGRLSDALRSARFVEGGSIPMTSDYPLVEPTGLVFCRARATCRPAASSRPSS